MTRSFWLAASRTDVPQSADCSEGNRPKTRDAPLLGAEASSEPRALSTAENAPFSGDPLRRRWLEASRVLSVKVHRASKESGRARCGRGVMWAGQCESHARAPQSSLYSHRYTYTVGDAQKPFPCTVSTAAL